MSGRNYDYRYPSHEHHVPLNTDFEFLTKLYLAFFSCFKLDYIETIDPSLGSYSSTLGMSFGAMIAVIFLFVVCIVLTSVALARFRSAHTGPIVFIPGVTSTNITTNVNIDNSAQNSMNLSTMNYPPAAATQPPQNAYRELEPSNSAREPAKAAFCSNW